MNAAEILLEALATGEWQLAKNPHASFLTEEANREHSWTVKREKAPFCSDDGARAWTGSSALGALHTAQRALGLPVACPASSATTVPTDDVLDALDDFALATMAPRGRESVRAYGRAVAAHVIACFQPR